MSGSLPIPWYRCKIDQARLKPLLQASDELAFRQVGLQLGLYALTATLAFVAFSHVRAENWMWTVPLAGFALFIHGTCSGFMGAGGPVHELCHRTPFRTRHWNDVFGRIYSFLSWTDPVGFRASHARHHQFTVHHDHDGEVVLPQTLDLYSAWFVGTHLVVDPVRVFNKVSEFTLAAVGRIRSEWMREVLPESNAALRAEHRNWARVVLGGHLLLAAVFIATGHWYLILIITFGAYFSGWLTMLCGMPQHIGMAPDVPDFRRCCRTYTCSWFPAFLYWNMQYHVEHHMFPAVPFYHLPKLRAALMHDLPSCTHGLLATWREIIPVVIRQRTDPDHVFVPKLPVNEGVFVRGEKLGIGSSV